MQTTRSLTAPEPKSKVDWLSLGFAAPWLILLSFPAAHILNNTNIVPVLALYALFSLIYLAYYGVGHRVRMLLGLPVTSAFIWTALLLVPVVGLVLQGPVNYIPVQLFSFTIYLMTVWLFAGGIPFRWRLRAGITELALFCLIFYVFSPLVGVPEWLVLSLTAYILVPALAVIFFTYLDELDKRRHGIEAELKIMTERERIARDVHDLLGHSLTVIVLKADLARKLARTDPARAEAELEAIAQLSRASLTEVRSTVTKLRSPNLNAEVRACAQALKAAGITAKLPEASWAQKVAGSNASLFSWVLREGTTNMVRHAQATRCQVAITDTGIEIIDNGVGLESRHGNGLSGMLQRVESAGGTLIIENAPAHWLHRNETSPGTRLRVSMDGSMKSLLETSND